MQSDRMLSEHCWLSSEEILVGRVMISIRVALSLPCASSVSTAGNQCCLGPSAELS